MSDVAAANHCVAKEVPKSLWQIRWDWRSLVQCFPKMQSLLVQQSHHSSLVNHRVVGDCESTLMFFCPCSKPVSFEYYWSMTLTSSSPWSTLQCQRFIECLLCAEPQAKQALSSFIFTVIIYTRITEAIEQEVSIKSEVVP